MSLPSSDAVRPSTTARSRVAPLVRQSTEPARRNCELCAVRFIRNASDPNREPRSAADNDSSSVKYKFGEFGERKPSRVSAYASSRMSCIIAANKLSFVENVDGSGGAPHDGSASANTPAWCAWQREKLRCSAPFVERRRPRAIWPCAWTDAGPRDQLFAACLPYLATLRSQSLSQIS